MEIKFKVSLKTIKRAFAFAELDIPSDEELESKLAETVIDLSGSDDADMKQAELGFCLIAIGKTFDK